MTLEPPQDVFDRIEAAIDEAEVCGRITPEHAERLRAEVRDLRWWDFPEDGHERLQAVEQQLAAARGDDAPEEEWPEPERLIELPPAPRLTSDLLPSALRPWLTDIAERLSVTLEMLAIAALVAAAGALGRCIGMYPKKHDSWYEVPNLWGALIAPSSSMKSPALRDAMAPLMEIAAAGMEAHESTRFMREGQKVVLLAKLDKLNKQASDPAAPSSLASEISAAQQELEELIRPPRRFITSDSTVEMLTELLRHNPRGLTVHRDELAGLLMGNKKKGREGDREIYLEAYTSVENYMVERVGRGSFRVPALTLSIIGGIQPGKMDALVLGAVNGGSEADGLLQRFQLAVYPERMTEYQYVDRPPDRSAREKVQRLFQLLADFNPDDHPELIVTQGKLPGLGFADDAQARFKEWIEGHLTRTRSGDLAYAAAFEAHLGKYPGLVVKLALLFHLLDTIDAGPIPPVSLDALDLAIAWCAFLEAHARKLYAPELKRLPKSVRALAVKVARADVKDGATYRDVYRHGWTGLKEEEDVRQAAQYLAGRNWVRIEQKALDGPGRPPSPVIRVNPNLVWHEDDLGL